jgi:hypothetical protein
MDGQEKRSAAKAGRFFVFDGPFAALHSGIALLLCARFFSVFPGLTP